MKTLEYTPIYKGNLNQLPNNKEDARRRIDIYTIVETVLFILASQYLIFQIFRACM